MRKILLLFLLTICLFYSCKKEEDNDCTNDCGSVTTHYAYVKGFVVDSASGLPIANAEVYRSDYLFSEGSGNFNVVTDANGMFKIQVQWYTGVANFGTLHLYRPDDTTDFYLNGFSIDRSGFVVSEWGVLIENDTVLVPNIYCVQDAYITTHIKDTTTIVDNGEIWWYYVIGPTWKLYPTNTDTIVTWKAFPGEIEYRLNGTYLHDSVTVNSGDTVYIDLFY